MTKAEMNMLERIFSSEIDAAISSQPLRGIFQTRSRVVQDLKQKGMVVEVEFTLPGRPPFGEVTVRGWALSPLGHLTYCMSCDAPEEPV